MKIYDRASAAVSTHCSSIIERFHPDLKSGMVSINLIFARAGDEEHAVMLHGHPCYAVIRITNPKERAAGRADAEMTINREKFEAMTLPQQDALLDHELYHLNVKKDKFGAFEMDDHHRVKLKMREHDREFGWFDEIARRHGENSFEVQQARNFEKQVGQLYLNFRQEDSSPVSTR